MSSAHDPWARQRAAAEAPRSSARTTTSSLRSGASSPSPRRRMCTGRRSWAWSGTCHQVRRRRGTRGSSCCCCTRTSAGSPRWSWRAARRSATGPLSESRRPMTALRVFLPRGPVEPSTRPSPATATPAPGATRASPALHGTAAAQALRRRRRPRQQGRRRPVRDPGRPRRRRHRGLLRPVTSCPAPRTPLRLRRRGAPLATPSTSTRPLSRARGGCSRQLVGACVRILLALGPATVDEVAA
mmetsp:Transcript_22434/g.76875  ORF Transcript_22434/g.76875 Transcript_22434/m.76875 type:complete len:242 (+) Transcript_22434:1065-1790(+)